MVTLPSECADALRSKAQIDRIGQLLVDNHETLGAIDGAKCYRMFRLTALEKCIKKIIDASPPQQSLLSARLKRLTSIRRKLVRSRERNYTIQLSQIDDIIGLRLVCDIYQEALEFSEQLSQMSHRVKNYVEQPQETGYRAIHHIFKIEQCLPGKQEPTSFTFEIQIRTYHQNQWGQWSESFGEQAKEGRAPSKTKIHLQELSETIQGWEEKNKNIKQNAIPESSKNYKLALVKRRETLASSFHMFEAANWDEALEHLFYWETQQPEEPDALLLASAADSNNMRKGLELSHPTFFRKVHAPLSLETNGSLVPIFG